ncbi:4970045a-2c86-44cb-b61f-bcbfd822b040 [Sclerotinia trifoliorum]|uniref:4970045a-2c86-44cb-b61f-bcbfd822b040 n=1 Tax=Sclerotinia trifoliorum TaxID=28548 RepID=A0A8H2ZJH1_9HELO|nr:4970045a-2c86-44cb-b61f-bcbfd822b040 [Sclerotinia trifoliorum]
MTSTLVESGPSFLPTSSTVPTFPAPTLSTPSVGNNDHTYSNANVNCSNTTTIGQVNEKYGFNILSEISPGIFRVTGDLQGTQVTLECIQGTLAGAMLLFEYNGRKDVFITWLRNYLSRKNTPHTFRAVYIVPDLIQSGYKVWMVGGSHPLAIRTSILEMKWSGRLYIARCQRSHSVLFKYLWKDIRSGLAGFIK